MSDPTDLPFWERDKPGACAEIMRLHERAHTEAEARREERDLRRRVLDLDGWCVAAHSSGRAAVKVRFDKALAEYVGRYGHDPRFACSDTGHKARRRVEHRPCEWKADRKCWR